MTPEDKARIDAIKANYRDTYAQHEPAGLWSTLKRLNRSDYNSALPRLDRTQSIDDVVNKLPIEDEYSFRLFNPSTAGSLIFSALAIAFYIAAVFMFIHLNQQSDVLKTFLGTLFFAGFGTLFLWWASRWRVTHFNTRDKSITNQYGLFFLRFSNTWRFSDFKGIRIKEKSHTMEEGMTRNSSSHYDISLVPRSGADVCFYVLHDGIDAMYTAKVISRITGLSLFCDP